MRKIIILLVLLLFGCTPEPIPNWSPAERYVNINVTFLPHEYPKTEQEVRKAVDLLELGINSDNFKRFVLNGNYLEDPQEVYETFMAEDINLTFALKPAYPNMPGYSVNKNPPYIINVYDRNRNRNIGEHSAIIAHEFGHTIGFHHKTKPYSGFSFFLIHQGEKFFQDIYNKIGGTPNKGYWLSL